MHARGIVVLARLEYIKHHHAKQLEAVLATLSPAERAVIVATLPVSKIPMPIYVHFNDAIAKVCAPNDPDGIFIAMGRASAEQNLREHQNGFLRVGDPHFVLAATPRLHRFYIDSGRVEYAKLAATTAQIRMIDLDTVSVGDCLTNKGWFGRAVELSGGNNVRVQHTRCRTREDDACVFTCQWT